MPGEQQDACKNLKGTKCPIRARDNVIYKLVMPVERNYPTVKLTIKFSLLGDNKVPQFCFSVRCQIVE